MKRQMSVSIFLAILLIALAWLYIKFSNETSPKENKISTENEMSSEPAITISQDYISYLFFVKVEDGRLVVYENTHKTIYMETSIEYHTLPVEVQKKADMGIFFKNEGELFDFLESYSS